MEGFAEFEFDLPKALKAELIELLDGMGTSLLQDNTAADLPDAQGVYQLFHRDQLVYIGKTDAEDGLRARLARHARKIRHRPGLVDGVRFKAVRVMVFTAMDLETQLIDHYRNLNGREAAKWNGSGFGANDTGSKRETTQKSPDGFDEQFPIDIDLQVELLEPGEYVVATTLATLKKKLPYLLRYETLRDARGRGHPSRPDPALLNVSVTIPPGPQTTRGLVRLCREALGPEWQATVFTSHVILYKETCNYRYGQVI